MIHLHTKIATAAAAAVRHSIFASKREALELYTTSTHWMIQVCLYTV